MGLRRKYVFRNVLFTIIFYLNFLITPTVTYVNLTLENDRVCPLKTAQPRIELGKDEKSALLIRETKYFSNLSGAYPFKCSFAVVALFNQGLFAVIQKMKLRKNATTNECIDYIQLCNYKSSPPETIFDFSVVRCLVGRQYCGEIVLPSKFEEANKTFVINPNAFHNEDGGIGVKIFISNRKLLPDEVLELEIAFTAYQPCARDIGSYKKCSSDYVSDHNSRGIGSCIYKGFFNDGIVNCPYSGCADECSLQAEDLNMSTKVTMTAVTSIFLSFFLFLGCMWMCRYFELLCWGVDNLRNGAGNNASHRRDSTGSNPPGNAEHRTLTPSAPSLPLDTSEDKDLPPSYETLFPDR